MATSNTRASATAAAAEAAATSSSAAAAAAAASRDAALHNDGDAPMWSTRKLTDVLISCPCTNASLAASIDSREDLAAIAARYLRTVRHVCEAKKVPPPQATRARHLLQVPKSTAYIARDAPSVMDVVQSGDTIAHDNKSGDHNGSSVTTRAATAVASTPPPPPRELSKHRFDDSVATAAPPAALLQRLRHHPTLLYVPSPERLETLRLFIQHERCVLVAASTSACAQMAALCRAAHKRDIVLVPRATDDNNNNNNYNKSNRNNEALSSFNVDEFANVWENVTTSSKKVLVVHARVLECALAAGADLTPRAAAASNIAAARKPLYLILDEAQHFTIAKEALIDNIFDDNITDNGNDNDDGDDNTSARDKCEVRTLRDALRRATHGERNDVRGTNRSARYARVLAFALETHAPHSLLLTSAPCDAASAWSERSLRIALEKLQRAVPRAAPLVCSPQARRTLLNCGTELEIVRCVGHPNAQVRVIIDETKGRNVVIVCATPHDARDLHASLVAVNCAAERVTMGALERIDSELVSGLCAFTKNTLKAYYPRSLATDATTSKATKSLAKKTRRGGNGRVLIATAALLNACVHTTMSDVDFFVTHSERAFQDVFPLLATLYDDDHCKVIRVVREGDDAFARDATREANGNGNGEDDDDDDYESEGEAVAEEKRATANDNATDVLTVSKAKPNTKSSSEKFSSSSVKVHKSRSLYVNMLLTHLTTYEADFANTCSGYGALQFLLHRSDEDANTRRKLFADFGWTFRLNESAFEEGALDALEMRIFIGRTAVLQFLSLLYKLKPYLFTNAQWWPEEYCEYVSCGPDDNAASDGTDDDDDDSSSNNNSGTANNTTSGGVWSRRLVVNLPSVFPLAARKFRMQGRTVHVYRASLYALAYSWLVAAHGDVMEAPFHRKVLNDAVLAFASTLARGRSGNGGDGGARREEDRERGDACGDNGGSSNCLHLVDNMPRFACNAWCEPHLCAHESFMGKLRKFAIGPPHSNLAVVCVDRQHPLFSALCLFHTTLLDAYLHRGNIIDKDSTFTCAQLVGVDARCLLLTRADYVGRASRSSSDTRSLAHIDAGVVYSDALRMAQECTWVAAGALLVEAHMRARCQYLFSFLYRFGVEVNFTHDDQDVLIDVLRMKGAHFELYRAAGHAFLNCVVSEKLYALFAEKSEGFLSVKRTEWMNEAVFGLSLVQCGFHHCLPPRGVAALIVPLACSSDTFGDYAGDQWPKCVCFELFTAVLGYLWRVVGESVARKFLAACAPHTGSEIVPDCTRRSRLLDGMMETRVPAHVPEKILSIASFLNWIPQHRQSWVPTEFEQRLLYHALRGPMEVLERIQAGGNRERKTQDRLFQRLEWLGDAVLDLSIMRDALDTAERSPEFAAKFNSSSSAEEFCTRIKRAIGRTETLALAMLEDERLTSFIQRGDCIEGVGKMSTLLKSDPTALFDNAPKALADTFEAVIGAYVVSKHIGWGWRISQKWLRTLMQRAFSCEMNGYTMDSHQSIYRRYRNMFSSKIAQRNNCECKHAFAATMVLRGHTQAPPFLVAYGKTKDEARNRARSLLVATFDAFFDFISPSLPSFRQLFEKILDIKKTKINSYTYDYNTKRKYKEISQ